MDSSWSGGTVIANELPEHFPTGRIGADFELKDAYIEGAKAAHQGVDFSQNPFVDGAKRMNWARGHKTATAGSCSF